MSLFKYENPNLGSASTVNTAVFGDVKMQTTEPITIGPLQASSITGYWLSVQVPEACTVVGIKTNCTVIPSVALTASVRKITADAVAPDATAGASCIELLSSAIDLHAAVANTVQKGALSAVSGALKLNAGDRIGLKLSSGTQTAMANLIVEVDLQKQ
jgi:hypothetical protein